MNPLSLFFAKYRLALLAVAFAAAFGVGWTVQGWRKNAEIAELKAERANEISAQYKDSLDDFVAASNVVKSAADQANVDVSVLDKRLSAIQKEFKNAKPIPLPPDCRLDDVRVRNLNEAAAAVNETIARRKPGAAVSPNSNP